MRGASISFEDYSRMQRQMEDWMLKTLLSALKPCRNSSHCRIIRVPSRWSGSEVLGNRGNLEIGSVRCTSLALASWSPDSQCDVSMATAGLYCRRYHDVNNWWLYTTGCVSCLVENPLLLHWNQLFLWESGNVANLSRHTFHSTYHNAFIGLAGTTTKRLVFH